jgi:4'-phosphopantetheinyl transferase
VATPINWEHVSQSQVLKDDEIHIWCADLDLSTHQISALWSVLSPDEQARAERFLQLKHRQAFIASRGILRHLLADYLKLKPGSISFAYNAHGKPFMVNPEGHDFFFNLSHSHDLALYAVTRIAEVGVDLEYIKKDFPAEAIAERFFSVCENQQLLSFPSEQRVQAFFDCWTRKEAFIKGLGQGLFYSLSAFDVGFSPQLPPNWLEIHYPEQLADATNWSLMGLKPALDYLGALALRGTIKKIQQWQYHFP